jgi:hypothetical protein
MRIVIGLGTFCLFLTCGCIGDAISSKILSVQLPHAGINLSLSMTDREVQEALKLIDEVMVSNGYKGDTSQLSSSDSARGIVVSYGIGFVSLRGDSLEVSFIEPMRRHSSGLAKRTCTTLKNNLIARYGPEKIRETE